MQYFARVIVSPLSPVPLPSRAIFCTASIPCSLDGTVTSHGVMPPIFSACVRRRLKPLSLLRRQFPSQESLGVQQTIQKPSPKGNHGVSEKVG